MQQPKRSNDVDPHGFDENRNYLTELLAPLVPAWLARRAVTVSVAPECRTYDRGDPVRFAVTIRNRLPVPVTLSTPQLRLWGWAVDGELEATDESIRTGDTAGSLTVDSREARRIEQVWNGRFERTGAGPNGQSEWVLPEPGTHELSVFLATAEPRPSDSVELVLR